jgi:arylsulfatase A
MKRKTPVLLLSVIFAACVFSAPAAERPNIIVIMTDDQGWGDTGYNGDPEVRTPNIDRLAASGVRFDNGYVTSLITRRSFFCRIHVVGGCG